jgi:hypothetical protein
MSAIDRMFGRRPESAFARAARAEEERLLAERECVEERLRARAARTDSQFDRLKRAALSVDPERLAETYAWHVLRGIAERSQLRGAKELREFEWGLQEMVRRAADSRADQLAHIGNKRKRGVAAKLANDKDGKQAAKAKARALWLQWQAGKVSFKGQGAFARHVCETFGLLDSNNVEAWCREWKKGSKGGGRLSHLPPR